MTSVLVACVAMSGATHLLHALVQRVPRDAELDLHHRRDPAIIAHLQVVPTQDTTSHRPPTQALRSTIWNVYT
jgi:hypothetical protein